jgi:Flp pilus assembly CpaE family ATPase
MQRPTRVVLALDAPDVSDEVVHALDRSGGAQVVATATDARQLAEAVRQLEPDLVLAEPRLAGSVPAGVPRITIASRESVAALRAAIEAGAAGFFVWPLERDELVERVRGSLGRLPTLVRRAMVVAVHASRGGAGCTFLATHLARAIASSGRSSVLIDVDPDGDDVATALGVGQDDAEGIHSIGDVAAVADELTPDALRGAAWAHPGGFHVIVAAREGVEPIAAADAQAVVDVAAASFDVVVLHTARGLDDATRRWLDDADVVCEVLTLDIGSFRGTSRTMARLGVGLDDPRWRLVVNRAARAEVVPADVQRVFGRPAEAVIPADAAVPRAQDRGRLVPGRSRAVRAVERLAERVRPAAELDGAA